MSDPVFQRYGAFYDLLYRDKDYTAEAGYVARILQTAAPQARSLLEFGSGTGRHGRLLAGHGFDVFGIERSEAMVAAARAAESPVRGSFDCRQGDIRSTSLGRTFDAAISLFHVISYQTANADLLQTFANAATHLNPGAVFFFDVWHGPAVLRERPSVRVKRVENDSIRLTRIAEPELDTTRGIVTVRYTMLAETKSTASVDTFGEEHRMRYLFPTEIDLLATQTGFSVERSEEFLSGRPADETTWGVAYLLRKAR